MGLIFIPACGEVSTKEAEPDDALLAQNFISTCVKTLGDPDKISSYMKISGAKPVTDPDILRMAIPETDVDGVKVWLHSIEDHPVFLVVNSGEFRGSDVQLCTMSFQGGSIEGAISEIAFLLNAKIVDDSIEAGQRYRALTFSDGDNRFLLNVTEGTPMGIEAATVSTFVLP